MSTESQTSQKQAVIDAVMDVMGSTFVSGQTNVKSLITQDQLTLVRQKVYDGIVAGKVAYNKDLSDTKTISRYVAGMVDNHLRKAKELNGGNQYKPSPTGTKSSKDDKLQSLTSLLKNMDVDSPEYESVLSAIEARKEQIAKEKKKRREDTALARLDSEVLSPELAGILSSYM